MSSKADGDRSTKVSVRKLGISSHGTDVRGGIIHPHPYTEENDFTDLVYIPHTFFTLGILVSSLLVILYTLSGEMLGNLSFLQAFIFPVLIFIVYCAVHLPDSYLVRPHPVLWRIIVACAILYTLVLSFLLCISLQDAREMLIRVDPKLRHPVVYKHHMADCRIMTETDPYHWASIITDEFVIAHSLGYWVKALMVRDAGVVLISSILFEIIEYSFQHWMSNFHECWWDHFVADFIICNGGGMILGLLTLRWLKVRKYNWVSLKQIPSLPGKAKRIAMQFTPREWTQHKWAFFYSPHRALCTLLMVFMIQWQEFNLFALKFVLDVPTTHFITLTRLAIFAAISFPATREYYEYCFTSQEKALDEFVDHDAHRSPSVSSETEEQKKVSHQHQTLGKVKSYRRLGMSAWITLLALILELFVICKFAKQGNFFQAPFPIYVSMPWCLSGFLWCLWFVVRYAGYHPTVAPVEQQSRVRRALSWVILFVSFLPMVGLCLMAAEDLQIGRVEFEWFVQKIWEN